jgi:AraC-like DNA-binding protein
MKMMLLTSMLLFLAMALALFTKRTTNYKANAFLASVYVAMSLVLFYYLIFHDRVITGFHVLQHLQVVFLYLPAPCLRFYVTCITHQEAFPRFKSVVHLCSILPGMVYYLSGHLSGYSQYISIPRFTGDSFFGLLLLLSGLIISVNYVFSSVRMVANIRANALVYDDKLIRWLKVLLPALVVVQMILFAYTVGVPLPEAVNAFMSGLLCVILMVLFLWQSHHAELFFRNLHRSRTRSRYEKSALSEHQLVDYESRLMDAIQVKCCYLNPCLKRNELAGMIGITPHQLSQVLSRRIGKSFHDLINEYRVIRAKELLWGSKSNLYTIESIASDCGFSNRITFFRVFKKITGITPTDYRQSQC